MNSIHRHSLTNGQPYCSIPVGKTTKHKNNLPVDLFKNLVL
jgi:hypothetical protein